MEIFGDGYNPEVVAKEIPLQSPSPCCSASTSFGLRVGQSTVMRVPSVVPMTSAIGVPVQV